MKQFFAHWVDITALVIPLFIALYYSIRLAKKYPVKGVAAFFFMYAPLVILVHMFFHLFNSSYVIWERVQAKSFVYDFRTYSLYLMGLVIAYQSYQLLQQGLYKCRFVHSSNGPIYKTMLAIGFVSLPTVFFTPIGSLPAMACLISLLALVFLKKKNAIADQAIPAYEPKAVAV
jgi:hypothetical protein